MLIPAKARPRFLRSTPLVMRVATVHVTVPVGGVVCRLEGVHRGKAVRVKAFAVVVENDDACQHGDEHEKRKHDDRHGDRDA